MSRLKRTSRTGLFAGLVALTVVTVGCETDSWLDPSNIGRFERTPIVQPILDSISIIEDDKGIALATDRVRPEDLRPYNREYIIGPGDTLRVTIYELRVPGLDDIQDRRVSETGDLRLAIVGEIPAKGRSPSQLEEDIRKKLDDDNKLRNATVSIQLLDSRQNTFSVFAQSTTGGTTSGTFVIPKPDFRVVEALTIARGIPGRTRRIFVIRQAALDDSVTGDGPADSEKKGNEDRPPADDDPGGLLDGTDLGEGGKDDKRPAPPTGVEKGLETDDDESTIVYIDGKPVRVKKPKADGDASEEGTDDEQLAELSKMVTQRIIEIPFQRLKDGDMRYNIVIRPGDIISVPDPNAGFVYAMGAINRPGAYTIPGERELTLYRLVASAGGLTGLAWPTKVDLVRQINDSEQAIVRLDLKAIANGSEPDIYLKANDIINIGTSGVAVPLAVFRNGLRMTYGFGFVLDRNFEDDVFTR